MDSIPVRKEGKEKSHGQEGLGKGEFNGIQAKCSVFFF